MSRREQLEQLLAESPGDVFLQYALGLELLKEGRHEEGLERLAVLMRGTPPYVPAFFMAAQHLAAQDRVEEARAALRKGIEHAREQGETHAAAEMSEMLADLGRRGE